MNEVKHDREHPIATGAGAVVGGVAGGVTGGAAAGAAVGGMTGPVGAAVGAVAGAVAGGLLGRGAARAVDPDAEHMYWRDNYASRPYVSGGSFDDYGPAYRHGVAGYSAYPGKRFEDVDDELAREWATTRGGSTLSWEDARPASRDAWQRLERAERAPAVDMERSGT